MRTLPTSAGQESGEHTSAGSPQTSNAEDRKKAESAGADSRNRSALHAPPYRKTVSTKEAAAALNRKPQTLRKWACLENGPIKPIRIYGRLAWYVDDIATLLEGGANNGH